jgi:hypothetical protein
MKAGLVVDAEDIQGHPSFAGAPAEMSIAHIGKGQGPLAHVMC